MSKRCQEMDTNEGSASDGKDPSSLPRTALFSSDNKTMAGSACSGGQSKLLITESSGVSDFLGNDFFSSVNGTYLDRSDEKAVG